MTLDRTTIGFALLTTLAVAAFFMAPSAQALPTTYRYTEFYRDATYTELVGWRLRDREGRLTSWGVVTDYRITEVDLGG